ncbi:MAG: Gfo/Idh/MocA family oxidoreductase [Cyclobacteriaceae bacterium]
MDVKINTCLVGLGRAGHFHLHSIKHSAHYKLSYIVDPNIGETDVPEGCTLLTDIDKALKDDSLDAVIVASPTKSHFGYIKRSLEAGKHVFTEKPLGHKVDEINDCFDLAQKSGLALHLGFQRRYDHNFIALKEKIPSLGSVRMIKASSRDNPKPSLDYLKISGNIFHDMLIHDFDMLVFLLGPRVPKTVYATGYSYDPKIANIPDFDTVLVILSYAEGLMVSIDTSRTSPYGYDQRIEVFGADAMAMVENEADHGVKVYNESGMSGATINYSFPQRYKLAYGKELEQFAINLYEQKPHNVTREECLLAYLIADAAHESAVVGKAVDFKDGYAGQMN